MISNNIKLLKVIITSKSMFWLFFVESFLAAEAEARSQAWHQYDHIPEQWHELNCQQDKHDQNIFGGKCSDESEHYGDNKDYSCDASLLVKHLLHLILESHHEESSKMIED